MLDIDHLHLYGGQRCPAPFTYRRGVEAGLVAGVAAGRRSTARLRQVAERQHAEAGGVDLRPSPRMKAISAG